MLTGGIYGILTHSHLNAVWTLGGLLHLCGQFVRFFLRPLAAPKSAQSLLMLLPALFVRQGIHFSWSQSTVRMGPGPPQYSVSFSASLENSRCGAASQALLELIRAMPRQRRGWPH